MRIIDITISIRMFMSNDEEEIPWSESENEIPWANPTKNAVSSVQVQGNSMVGQYTETMTHNQIWEVGFVRWPSRVLAEENQSPIAWTSSRSCQ